MTLADTIRNASVASNGVLTADCQKIDGSWVQSSINLDTYIRNSDGTLDWDGAAFAASARNLAIGDNIQLTGDLEAINGNWISTSLGLGARIANMDGQLTYQAVSHSIVGSACLDADCTFQPGGA